MWPGGAKQDEYSMIAYLKHIKLTAFCALDEITTINVKCSFFGPVCLQKYDMEVSLSLFHLQSLCCLLKLSELILNPFSLFVQSRFVHLPGSAITSKQIDICAENEWIASAPHRHPFTSILLLWSDNGLLIHYFLRDIDGHEPLWDGSLERRNFSVLRRRGQTNAHMHVILPHVPTYRPELWVCFAMQ